MASAVIGALRVNLGIDTAQFSEGLKGIRGTMDRVGRQMQNWGASLSTYVTAPLVIAGGAVTAAVTGITRDVQELKTAAQVANVGFEEFQRLAYAAKSVGFESDKLADIYKDVNDRVGDFVATGGGPMADFFENIAPKVGITAEAFKNLSGPQALQLYYDSLVKAGASQQDMTFYLEAMASDATALIPLLANAGQGFTELGSQAAVVSEDQAAGLKAYNDQMAALGQAIKAVTIAVATSGLLEWLTGIAQGLAEWLQWLSTTNPEILKWGAVIAGLAAAIGPVLISIGLITTAFAAISTPVLAAVAAFAAVAGGIALLYQGIQIAWPYIQQLAGEVWAQIKAGVERAQQAFIGFHERVIAIGQQIIDAFVAIPARMIEIGAEIMDGLWQGLQNKMGAIKDGVVNFASDMVNSVKSTLGIHSPSKVMAEIGVNVMQGLGQGMDSMAGSVGNTASSIGSMLTSSLGGLIDGSKKIKDVLKDLAKQLANSALQQGMQALFGGGKIGGGIFGGLLGGLFGGFTSTPGGFGKMLGLPGFANGGSFQVGGAGGIDSQVVAFRASPNEHVSITKPGQGRHGASGVADVRVFVDRDGNWQAAVERISDGRIGQNNRRQAEALEKRQANAWRTS